MTGAFLKPICSTTTVVNLTVDLDIGTAHDGREEKANCEQCSPTTRGDDDMNQTEAKRLGRAFKKAREDKGRSVWSMMKYEEFDTAWVYRLENGQYANPDPIRLLRYAEAVGLDPTTIDDITGNTTGDSLPSVRTYFRSTTQASPNELDEIEREIARIHRKYGQPRESSRPTQSSGDSL